MPSMVPPSGVGSTRVETNVAVGLTARGEDPEHVRVDLAAIARGQWQRSTCAFAYGERAQLDLDPYPGRGWIIVTRVNLC